MFLGTTPKLLLEYLIGEIKRIKPKRIFLLFSGNFGVEKAISNICPDIEIISTDISLYSRAIGFGLINKKFQVEYRPELLEQFPFFKDKTSPIDYAVAVIFFLEVAKNLGKENHKYYKSLNNEAKINTEVYYNQIKSKLLSFANTLKNLDFRGIDAIELIDECKKDDMVFFDPPFWTDGYDIMFKHLEKCFDFEIPKFTVIDEEKAFNSLALLHKKECIVYYRRLDKAKLSNFNIVFKHQYKYHAYYYIYSNKRGALKNVSRFSPLSVEQPYYKLISEKDEININSTINILPCNSKIANHYRLLWVKKAEMTTGGLTFLIFIDNLLIGLLQVESSLAFGSEWAIIYSDPSAPTSKYKRLSKLVLALCLTESFINEFNEKTLWLHKGFTTSVFTNFSVSMKYRNLFNLSDRVNNKEGSYKYKLVYRSKKLFKDYKFCFGLLVKKRR